MNYYINGDAANAEQIKAAFEAKGYDISWPGGCANPDVFNIGVERNGAKYVVAETYEYIKDIIKTHPGYKELELPVEPKFNVGDWIVQNDNGTVSQITKVINDTDEYGEYRAYEHTNGYFAACFEGEYHLWTIADAKDGDVLYSLDSKQPFIYKERPQFSQARGYCCINKFGEFAVWNTNKCVICTGKYIPATKEQRDMLFKKMKKAGYQWNPDKKELKKIQPHYDVANFHAGMPVLVRECDTCVWQWVPYSHFNGVGLFFAAGKTWRQCIPFNEETKHLLGTTDMPSEEFINW